MLDPKLEKILNQLLESARLKRYEFISLEHVLLALSSKDEETQDILEACGTDLKLLAKKLEEFIKSHCPLVTEDFLESDPEWRPELTMAFHRLLQRAAIQVQSSGKKMVQKWQPAGGAVSRNRLLRPFLFRGARGVAIRHHRTYLARVQ